MSYSFEERVKNSIELLDEVAGKLSFVPANWRELINLEALNMDSCTYCILGQLWMSDTREDDGYANAKDALDSYSVRDVYSDKYEFSSGTAEWIKQLSASTAPKSVSSKFNPGDVWQDAEKCCTRTVKKVVDIDGETFIIFTEGAMIAPRLISESKFVYGFTLKPKRILNKGDVLTGPSGARYYYFSDAKVIKVSESRLGWCDLAYYERKEALTLAEYSSGDHFFSGEFFWNNA
jgi:hypothetical protein